MLALTNYPELCRFASMGSRRRLQPIKLLSKLSFFSSLEVQSKFKDSSEAVH